MPVRIPARAGDDARTQVATTALALFGERGVEATSLQMIADRMGVTKAAVYYHFRTKEAIVLAAVAPALDALRSKLQDARAVRGRAAQVDAVLGAMVDVTWQFRGLLLLVQTDAALGRILEAHGAFVEHKALMEDLLAGPEPGPRARIAMTVVLSGIACAAVAPELAHLDEELVKATVIDLGRRMLGRRGPRAPACLPSRR